MGVSEQYRLKKRVHERLLGVELVRIVGAAGICWFHLGVSAKTVAYSGLPMFMIISMILSTPTSDITSLVLEFRKRINRLIYPWLKFSIAYAFIQSYFSFRNGLPIFSWWRPEMVLYGTSIHLWFLPAAFVGSVVTLSFLYSINVRAYVLTGAIAALLGFVGFKIWATSVNVVPLLQWKFILGSLVLGLIVSYLRSEHRLRLSLVTLVMAGVGCFWVEGGLSREEWNSFGLGAILSATSLSVNVGAPRFMRNVPSISFLTYLIHPVVGLIVCKLTGFESPSDRLAFVALICTLVVSAVLSEMRWVIRLLL